MTRGSGRRLVVVSAGLSTPSSTRLLADQITGAVESRTGALAESATTTTIELRELAGPLATTLTAGGLPAPPVAGAMQQLARADGLIAVTPVFSGSYSGLFKLFFDVIDPESLAGMPVLIAATAGTPRHSLMLDYAMRPLFTYLQAVVVPTGVFAATDDFGGPGTAALADRVSAAATELAALMVADTAGVAGFGPSSPERSRQVSPLELSNDVTPFEQLLEGHTGER